MSHTLIIRTPIECDEAFGYQSVHQSAQIAGVETESAPQGPETGTDRADLIEDARLSKRSAPAQEAHLERARPLGDQSVERASCGDLLLVHPLTIVRYITRRKRGIRYAATSLQTWVNRKQTTTPMATGSSVATVVHFALRVSLKIV